MAAEFDCCECCRHIVAIVPDTPPEPPLCLMCQFNPGWYRIPEVRALIDPEHNGLEIWEREAQP